MAGDNPNPMQFLVDEMKKIQTSQKALGEMMFALQRKNEFEGSPTNTVVHPSRGDDGIKLSDLPEFDGLKGPDSYLTWERRMERMFDHKGMADSKRFKHAILKLSDYASDWFDSFQGQRKREGKSEIETWTDLKAKMKKRFVPRTYRHELFLKLNSLQQGYMGVEQYTKEFERLSLACDCHDSDDQKSAKFLLGLRKDIANQVELQPYYSFDELCVLAKKVERQQQDSKSRGFKPSYTPKLEVPKQEGSDHKAKSESSFGTVGSTLSKPPLLTPSQSVMKGKQCFKCQGHGHIAKQCPNLMIVSYEEHVSLLTQDQESLPTSSTSDDVTLEDSLFHSNLVPPVEEDEVRHVGILRKILHVEASPMVDLEQRENLFHTRCLVGSKVCSLIVDGGSCTNVVDSKVVDDLKLQTRAHIRPYKLSWLSEGNGIKVTKQALVNFELGEYNDAIWCDIVPMTACNILLGRPWQFDREVLHHGRDNIYSVKVGQKRFNLAPLPPKLQPLPSNTQEVVCLADFSASKKVSKADRRASVLNAWKKPPFDVGDFVFLSLNAQKVYNNSKGKQENIEEGPFKIVHREGYDTFQILLGQGVCVSMAAEDLVPCHMDGT